jgi:hypothetical protein
MVLTPERGGTMMTSKPAQLVFIASIALVCCLAAGSLPEQARSKEQVSFPESLKDQLQARTSDILAKNCSVAGCHSGSYPKAKLMLTPETFADAVKNAPSREVDSLRIVDLEKPEMSYLLMKVRGAKGIKGDRMPLDAPALREDEIQTIELWIYALAVLHDETAPAVSPAGDKKKALTGRGETRAFDEPAFYGRSLIDLPTTETPAEGEILFRISHRFIEPTNAGHQYFLGLDGPAYILLSLAYGVTDRVSLGLGRTNLLDEIELSSRCALLRQGVDFSAPISATLIVGVTLTTERPPGASLFDSDNMHFNAQLALSRQVTERFSLLCVPSFSSNTDYAQPAETNTTSLGVGSRLKVIENVCLIGEWTPVLAGGETANDTWGIGFEARKGGHVFHVFVTDAYGLTPDQYIPGGDLKNSDVRFGFNIYRTL